MTITDLHSNTTHPVYSICFSPASILRCDAPSQLQLELLLIPPALELLFSLCIIFKQWKSLDRRAKGYWLLLVEAWLYGFLAILDVIIRIHPDPAGRVVRIASIVIGALSNISLLFYTTFLFILLISSQPNPAARASLLSNLPTRLQPPSKVLLVVLIPLLLVSNALANSLDVSFSLGHAGFTSNSLLDTHTFLASLTLALLSLFSALSFLLLAYQCLLVLTHDSPLSSQERIHLMCGLPWLALGSKLAFVDAIAGFAPMAFPGVMFRRILRFGGRTALVWGGSKGLDYEEDFSRQGGLEQVLRGRGKGMVRIGSPRALSPRNMMQNNGLRPLSPNIRYQGILPGHSYGYGYTNSTHPPSPTHPPRALMGSTQALLRRERAGDRVTVHYQHGYAPHLEVRLSGLGVPDTATLVRSIKQRGLLDGDPLERQKSVREMRQERKQMERELDGGSQGSGPWVYSTSSEDWNFVRFPSPSNTAHSPLPPPVRVQRAATIASCKSTFSSLRRKSVPTLLSPLPTHSGIRHSTASGGSPLTAASQRTFGSAGTYETRDSGEWLATASRGRYTPAIYRTTGASIPVPVSPQAAGNSGNPFSPGPGSTSDVDRYDESYRRSFGRPRSSPEHVTSVMENLTIKAIRTAPHRATPSPTRVEFLRRSIEIERGITPSSDSSGSNDGNQERHGDDESVEDDGGNVEGDSEILGHAI